MLKPKTTQRLDAALGIHLWLIGGLAAATLVVALRPGWILDAGYRCQMQVLFGLRCPFCGMTRDFAAMLHGAKPVLNPGSWFAALVVYVLYPVGLVIAWRRGRLDVFHSSALRGGMVAALTVMLVLNNLR